MISREKFLDTGGRYLTQSLFLENNYTDFAIYTLKDYDHTYEGKVYPSLKKLYMELEDVTEYDFADTYLAGWNHWQRICANKLMSEHVAEWRAELELKLRARAAKKMMELADQGQYQAVKWLADRGWDTRAAGRPSKLEKESHVSSATKMAKEYDNDVIRLFKGV